MKKILKAMANFFKEEDGATAVEYALMVALIAAVIIAGVTLLGTSTNNVFEAVSNELDGVASNTGS